MVFGRPVTAAVLGNRRTIMKVHVAPIANTPNKITKLHSAWIQAITGIAVAETENVIK